MPRVRATCSALPRSREAIALTSTQSPFCMAGKTFLTPIAAVLKTPQRTLFGIDGHDRAFSLLLFDLRLYRIWLLLLAAGPHGIALFQKGPQTLFEIRAVADLF